MKESLSIVILEVVGILGSQLIFFSLLSSKKDNVKVLEEGFLKIEKAEMFFEECFIIQQVWDLSLEYICLQALELALERKLDKSENSPTHWELFWKPGGSYRLFIDLFGFFELTIIVVRRGVDWKLYKS